MQESNLDRMACVVKMMQFNCYSNSLTQPSFVIAVFQNRSRIAARFCAWSKHR
jgi:hypothetical protein